MSEKIFIVIAFMLGLFLSTITKAQTPQGFNYSALVRNADGSVINNQDVDVKVTLQDEMQAEVYYSETHKVTTNSNGLLSFVIGGGTPEQGSFASIPWQKGKIFIQLSIKQGDSFKPLGSAVQLQSVPYALYAQKTAEGVVTNNGEVLFAVKNTKGDTVFAVYEEGVRVFVEEPKTGKGSINRGGFAVATRGLNNKNEITDVFTVTPDQTRIYINEEKDGGKIGINRGGFAVATRGLSNKGESKDVLTVTGDQNVQVTFDENKNADKSKGSINRGGFAVATRGLSNKGENIPIFTTNTDSTRIYLKEIESKGSINRGGFAVATRGLSKGKVQNNFDISTSKTAEIVNGENRILWYPKKNAFMAGRIVVPSADSVGENSFACGYESKAKGAYSTAIGNKAIADSANSFAFGENAQALNAESYAIGRNAKAIGKGSFAFGSGCIDGTYGEETWDKTGAPQSTGDYSYAFGLGSIASGYGSFVMGYKNRASNYFSTAIGVIANATGYASIAMGELVRATGKFSIAIGRATEATGKFSIAMGRATEATNNSCISMGDATSASGIISTAMGNATSASGSMSTAMGRVTKAMGDISTAMGESTQAIGRCSMTTGRLTIASGDYSTAMGHTIEVKGEKSFGIGLSDTKYTITNDSTMAIMGGKLGICTVSPSLDFQVNGTAGGTNNWSTTSDKRYKKDIKAIEGSLQKVLKLRGVNYYWKKSQYPDMKFSDKQQIGVIAQEVEIIFPELVQTDNNGYKSVQYAKFTPILIEAVKELSQENTTLKAELQALKEKDNNQSVKLEKQNSDIKDLQKQIQELKQMFNTVNK